MRRPTAATRRAGCGCATCARRHDRAARPPLAHRADRARDRHRHRRHGRRRRHLAVQPRRPASPQLDALGTDLLRVAPGQTAFGEATTLPESARDTVARIGPVTEAAGFTYVAAAVRRNDHISESVTGGIARRRRRPRRARRRQRRAGDRPLPRRRVRASCRPSCSAPTPPRRLGIHDLDGGPRVWLGDEWFAVIGILEPAPLAPELDSAALIGYPVADELFETTRSPSTLFVRTVPEQVEAVRDVLARTVDPQKPDEVDVSRPSDALEARADDRRGAAQPAARARRRRPRRRRRRDHERDGDLGARAARRDRRAPGARRPPRPRRRPVPRRGRRARHARRASAARRSARPSRRSTRRPRAGSSTCPSRPSPAAPPPRSPSGCSPASPPPSVPLASTLPTPSARSESRSSMSPNPWPSRLRRRRRDDVAAHSQPTPSSRRCLAVELVGIVGGVAEVDQGRRRPRSRGRRRSASTRRSPGGSRWRAAGWTRPVPVRGRTTAGRTGRGRRQGCRGRAGAGT